MLKYAGAMLVVLAVAGMASAAPSLSYTYVPLSGGLYGYTFTIHNNDGQLASYAVTLGFQSPTLHQIQDSAGNEIENQQIANLRDGKSGYSKALDTWAYAPFGGNPIAGTSPLTGDAFTGFRPTQLDPVYVDESTAGWWEMACGTGSGSALGDNVNVAYVVAGPDGLMVKGSISRLSAVTIIPTSYVIFDEGTMSFPLAHGPYTIAPGQTLSLDASGSSASYPVTGYQWDLDYGIPGRPLDYETDAGALAKYDVSYDYLTSLGLQAGHTYDIGLRIHGTTAGVDSPYGVAHTSLTILPEPASLALLGLGAAGLLRRRGRA